MKTDPTVLAGHIPLITSVQPGTFHMELEDGSVKSGRADGGILTVSKDAVLFLTGSLEWV